MEFTNKRFPCKDYSGIKIAKKEERCCDCGKTISKGTRYLSHRKMNEIKIRCLPCRQKILDSL